MPVTYSRRVFYLLDDGTLSRSSSDAKYTDLGEILVAAAKSSSELPPGFFYGTALREAGMKSNTVEEELNDDGSVKVTTYGVFQIDAKEAAAALVWFNPLDPAPALCDVYKGAQVFAAVMSRNLRRIGAAAGFSPPVVPDDAWCYLAWSHNNGIGAVLKSIANFGMNWEALKARPQNAYMTERLIPYAEEIREQVRRNPFVPASAGESVDSPAQLDTLIGAMEPHDARLVIVLAVLALVGFVLWEAFG